jgi:hypothetical protein
MSPVRTGRAFSLQCRLAAGVSPAQADVVLHSLAVTVDERGLALLRTVGKDLSFVVVPSERDASDEDRRALARWAITRHELADYRVGRLRDSGP